MHEIIAEKILQRLKQSEYWTEKTNAKGKYVSGLKCPECLEFSGWVYADGPFTIQCHRLNNCGVITKISNLFPDIFHNLEKEYPSGKADPHKPARIYLQTRGINISLDGLDYEYWPNVRNLKRGAVMFKIDGTTWNGRLINPLQGEGKTHNKGSTSGKFWKHPAKEYKADQETFIVEGIITSLSLIELGFQSIALLSSNQDLSKIDLSEFKKPVFALDNDPAGIKALKKAKEIYPDAGAILPIKGDWNDLLISNSIEKVQEYFKEKRKEFEFKARLALTEDAISYATIYNEFYDHLPGLFIFNKCYYYSQANKSGEPDVFRVSNFTIEVDHYQLDLTNQDEPTNRYFLKIKPAKGKTVDCIVSASDISSSSGFMQMLLQRARVLWEGTNKPFLALVRKIVEANAPVVRQLQTIGYDKESGYYIFKDFGINNQGIMIALNSKGFIELSKNNQIRPAQYTTLKPVQGFPPEKIYNLVYQAWGERALVGYAWMTSGWFVHLIKEKIGFFPFLSFYYDTQTGKTKLTRFMNACQCLDEEGLPMRKINTGKGEIRKLAQRAGLFKALLEGNNEDSTRFDIDSILTLYNDNPLQVRALKSNDIQTQEIPFLASLLFVQNKEPFKSKAQKERVISVKFNKEDITEETSKAFYQLTQISIAEMSYFFPHVMKFREKFESNWFNAFTDARKELNEVLQDARIIENHALILAFHRLLSDVLNFKIDLKFYIEAIAKFKQTECLNRIESLADIFFDLLDKIPSEEAWFIDRASEGFIYINLNEAYQKINDEKYKFQAQIKDLQSSLEAHPAKIDSNKHHWFIKKSGQTEEKKQLRAWVFDARKILE